MNEEEEKKFEESTIYFDHFLTDITQFEFPDTFAASWLAQFVLTFDQSKHLQKNS